MDQESYLLHVLMSSLVLWVPAQRKVLLQGWKAFVLSSQQDAQGNTICCFRSTPGELLMARQIRATACLQVASLYHIPWQLKHSYSGNCACEQATAAAVAVVAAAAQPQT